MTEDDNQTIECHVGPWYFKRMVMMAAMLGIFAAWFLYDGKIGYAKKNRAALAEEAFAAAGAGSTWEAYAASGPAIADLKPEGELRTFAEGAFAAGKESMPWSDFARKNSLPEDPAAGSPEANVKDAFTAGKVPGAVWEDFASTRKIPVDPSSEQDIALKRAFESAGQKREFAGYAASLGFDSKGNKYHTRKEISQQLFIAGVCGAGAILAIILLVLNRKRVLRADGEAIILPNGTQVPFASAFRIDKRKWDHKGLAYVHYREGGAEKKAVIDDLKFVGAGKILDRLLARFEGQLVEREVEADEVALAADGASQSNAGEGEKS